MLLIAMLSACSLVFDPADPAALSERPGADAQVDGDGSPIIGDDADGEPMADAAPPGDAHQLVCDPFDGACGCYVGNDPSSPPACGAEGDNANCTSCSLSRDCAPGLFCTGFTTSPGECRRLCGGPDDVGCPSPSTCVSTYWDGFDWWGYCGGACL